MTLPSSDGLFAPGWQLQSLHLAAATVSTLSAAEGTGVGSGALGVPNRHHPLRAIRWQATWGLCGVHVDNFRVAIPTAAMRARHATAAAIAAEETCPAS